MGNKDSPPESVADGSHYEGPERRRTRSFFEEIVRVRLLRKHSGVIDGVDVSTRSVGERFYVPRREAALLVAEKWAEWVPSEERRRTLKRLTQAVDYR